MSLADLQNDNDAERSFRKFRLIAEDVQGRNVLTNFHGMDLTTDKLRSMVKKWQVSPGFLALLKQVYLVEHRGGIVVTKVVCVADVNFYQHLCLLQITFSNTTLLNNIEIFDRGFLEFLVFSPRKLMLWNL